MGRQMYLDEESGQLFPVSDEPVREKETRADRIRSMTNEELAKLLSGKIFYPWCEKEPCSGDCETCILEWLEADND